MELALVVAMARNRVIGRDGTLPWHLPADLRHFRALTMGKPIVMGRRTHASLGRPLPGRRNVVLTASADYRADGCEVYRSLGDALHALKDVAEVMIVGGARLYAEALPHAQRLYVTDVLADIAGDVTFPPFDEADWDEVACEPHAADATHAYDYRFRTLVRISRTPPASST